MTQSFKDLDVWKMALRLNETVYLVTRKLPEDSSRATISTRLRRASVSIAANIAEGANRNCKEEFLKLLGASCVACNEVEGQLLLIKSSYTNLVKETNHALSQLMTVGRMIKILQASMAR